MERRASLIVEEKLKHNTIESLFEPSELPVIKANLINYITKTHFVKPSESIRISDILFESYAKKILIKREINNLSN